MNNFERDLEQEQIPILFLKEKFFPYINNEYNINVQYVEDIPTQLSGIDLMFHYPDSHTWNVDIKAQMNKYISKPTNTFCLEIEYLKNGIIKTGWLLNNDLKTDIYGFIWINDSGYIKKGNNILLDSPNMIKTLTIFFIHKQIIYKYLNSIGLTYDVLMKNVNQLKSMEVNNGTRQLRYNNDVKFFQSCFLPEQPINLVVSNKVWKQLACCKYKVTNNEILKIN